MDNATSFNEQQLIFTETHNQKQAIFVNTATGPNGLVQCYNYSQMISATKQFKPDSVFFSFISLLVHYWVISATNSPGVRVNFSCNVVVLFILLGGKKFLIISGEEMSCLQSTLRRDQEVPRRFGNAVNQTVL